MSALSVAMMMLLIFVGTTVLVVLGAGSIFGEYSHLTRLLSARIMYSCYRCSFEPNNIAFFRLPAQVWLSGYGSASQLGCPQRSQSLRGARPRVYARLRLHCSRWRAWRVTWYPGEAGNYVGWGQGTGKRNRASGMRLRLGRQAALLCSACGWALWFPHHHAKPGGRTSHEGRFMLGAAEVLRGRGPRKSGKGSF